MKRSLLLLLLLLTLAACSKDADPIAVPTPGVIYTDAAGKEVSLTTYHTRLITPPPSTTGQERRVFEVTATLPDGSTLGLLYYCIGNAAPAAKGAVALDEYIQIARYPSGTSGYGYYGSAGATGGLNVDALNPTTFSGSYAGPMMVGSPPIRVRFQRLQL